MGKSNEKHLLEKVNNLQELLKQNRKVSYDEKIAAYKEFKAYKKKGLKESNRTLIARAKQKINQELKSKQSRKRKSTKSKSIKRKRKITPNPEMLLEQSRKENGGIVPIPSKKPLILSFELTWRTEEDKRFMRSAAWKKIRLAILIRDDYTCSYCGFKTDNTRYLNVHHVDGVPTNHEFSNLQTVCNHCHMIMHSGLWAAVHGTLDIYEEAAVSQEKVIRITREQRELGKSDKQIIKICGLKRKTVWKQDHEYLKTKIGFVSSRKVL